MKLMWTAGAQDIDTDESDSEDDDDDDDDLDEDEDEGQKSPVMKQQPLVEGILLKFSVGCTRVCPRALARA